jgi:hypothetical protein
LCFIELAELGQRAAQGDARGQIIGMMRQAGAADVDRFLVVAGAPVFFSELRKSHRRRVRLDPASKIEHSWIVAAHAPICTTA